MSDTVIRVENLGKKYIIGHQKQPHYTALRDVITDRVKSFSRKLLKPFGKQEANPAYEEFWALKDLYFEVKQGDIVGIIGRNGAGKSTLLKILSRITEPTHGRIFIKGRVASLLEVGTGFHPELTGRENIYLNGAILGMSKVEIKNKFDEIVNFAEVEKFLDTPVKRYSSGMYVRLAFAVAAHLEPEILVVDEVLAVGDVEFQKKCMGKMGDVATKEGRTVLFVSHNMAAIEQLCGSAILLEKGKVVNQGRSLDVINSYLGKYAASEMQAHRQLSNIQRNYAATYGKDYLGKPIIAGISILNAEEEATCVIKWGKPFKFRLLLWGSRREVTLNVAITIKDLKGNFVFVSHSTDSGLFVEVPYSYQVEVDCHISPNILMPGHYTADVWVGDQSWNWLDFLQDVILFEVPRVDTSLSARDCRPGNIYIPLKWERKTVRILH